MINRVFVFGSNLAGRHGAGAALEALRNHGAILGQGVGAQGDSYAISTKDKQLAPLSLAVIQMHVNIFLAYARDHSDLRFDVTRVGCGLAGYSDDDIAPLFESAPKNCHLPYDWEIRRKRGGTPTKNV